MYFTSDVLVHGQLTATSAAQEWTWTGRVQVFGVNWTVEACIKTGIKSGEAGFRTGMKNEK